jgi:hypothetical protein
MMRKLLSAFSLLIAACLVTTTETDAQRVNAPPKQPEVFGPGVLSTGNVYRGSFAPDGRTFYFFKKVTEGKEDYRIFISRLIDGKWSEPERVNLGGEYSDLYPAISKDGRRMVFSSYRPVPGEQPEKPNAHLWYVDRKGDGWGDAVFMKSASQFGHYNSGPEFGPEGAIYFGSTTPDWRTKHSLITRWKDGAYSKAEPFEAIEKLKGWRSDIQLWGGTYGPDGSFIILGISKINPENRRPLSSDLWVMFKTQNGWTEPKPLGAGINTDATENFVFFSPDGQEMFFVRDFATFYRVSLKEALDSAK